MINRELLLKNGYKQYKANPYFKPHASALYQKAIRTPEGQRKYFIDVYEYNYSPAEGVGHISYEVEVQFTTEQNRTLNTLLHYQKDLTVKEVETFFSDLYIHMFFKPYDKEDKDEPCE